jgi:hypothetical protein
MAEAVAADPAVEAAVAAVANNDADVVAYVVCFQRGPSGEILSSGVGGDGDGGNRRNA